MESTARGLQACEQVKTPLFFHAFALHCLALTQFGASTRLKRMSKLPDFRKKIVASH